MSLGLATRGVLSGPAGLATRGIIWSGLVIPLQPVDLTSVRVLLRQRHTMNAELFEQHTIVAALAAQQLTAITHTMHHVALAALSSGRSTNVFLADAKHTMLGSLSTGRRTLVDADAEQTLEAELGLDYTGGILLCERHTGRVDLSERHTMHTEVHVLSEPVLLHDTVELDAIYTMPNGVRFDPADVTLTTTSPTGTVLLLTYGVDVALTRIGQGHFRYVLVASLVGKWKYEWRADDSPTNVRVKRGELKVLA